MSLPHPTADDDGGGGCGDDDEDDGGDPAHVVHQWLVTATGPEAGHEEVPDAACLAVATAPRV